MTMTLIETVTLASSASSIEFTSIPQDGVDLLVLFSGRNDTTNSLVYLQPNGSTTNLSMVRLTGDGSSVFSSTASLIWSRSSRSDSTANTFSSSKFYISNYAGSAAKSVSVDGVTENNGTLANQEIVAGLWNDSTAITSVELVPGLSNFASGSTASLYKIS